MSTFNYEKGSSLQTHKNHTKRKSFFSTSTMAIHFETSPIRWKNVRWYLKLCGSHNMKLYQVWLILATSIVPWSVPNHFSGLFYTPFPVKQWHNFFCCLASKRVKICIFRVGPRTIAPYTSTCLVSEERKASNDEEQYWI